MKRGVALRRAGHRGEMSRGNGVPLLGMRGIDDKLQDNRRVSKTTPPVLCMRIARPDRYGVRGVPQRPITKTCPPSNSGQERATSCGDFARSGYTEYIDSKEEDSK